MASIFWPAAMYEQSSITDFADNERMTVSSAASRAARSRPSSAESRSMRSRKMLTVWSISISRDLLGGEKFDDLNAGAALQRAVTRLVGAIPGVDLAICEAATTGAAVAVFEIGKTLANHVFPPFPSDTAFGLEHIRPGHARIIRLAFIPAGDFQDRSEEHTSELQSQSNIVCRLLLEKN